MSRENMTKKPAVPEFFSRDGGRVSPWGYSLTGDTSVFRQIFMQGSVASAAAVVGVAAPAAAIAAAAEQDDKNDDDPAAVISAKTTVTHKRYLLLNVDL